MNRIKRVSWLSPVMSAASGVVIAAFSTLAFDANAASAIHLENESQTGSQTGRSIESRLEAAGDFFVELGKAPKISDDPLFGDFQRIDTALQWPNWGNWANWANWGNWRNY